MLLRRRGAIEQAIRRQREGLGVTREQLVSAAMVDPRIVEKAETDADQLGIRVLEHLAFVLGLDPMQLSVDERAEADAELGVRLRVLEQDASIHGGPVLGPRTVLRFSEAASAIRTQKEGSEAGWASTGRLYGSNLPPTTVLPPGAPGIA